LIEVVMAATTVSRRKPTRPAAVRKFATLQDVLDYLGGVPADRVHLFPWPGTATQRDMIHPPTEPKNAICELIDGILVEKAVGYHSSRLALILATFLQQYLMENENIGCVNAGGDGYIKLKPKRIVVPDVSFVRWEQFPGGQVTDDPCPEVVADLIVEVLSKGNTRREMDRKRREFFESGTRLFWIVDPKKQAVTVYRPGGESHVLGLNDSVDGEDVLPGFRLSIRKWFELASGKPPRKS
jgi:Uma2 family endonuclease